MVNLCDLDFDVLVDNGDEKRLRTVNVYHVGISNTFGGETIS